MLNEKRQNHPKHLRQRISSINHRHRINRNTKNYNLYNPFQIHTFWLILMLLELSFGATDILDAEDGTLNETNQENNFDI